MTEQELARLITEGEGSYLEFKAAEIRPSCAPQSQPDENALRLWLRRRVR
jgi:hypothetical protein